jgi:hypothetical protein
MTKANKYDYIVCPDCDYRHIEKESYEILKIHLNALAGWAGVNVEIPSAEEFDAIERAKWLRSQGLKFLGIDEDSNDT